MITLQCLLEIHPFQSSDVIRIQNYQVDDLIWDSVAWNFAGFTFRSYPEQKLDLGNESAEILVSNNEVTASILRDYNGLRRAVVYAYHLQVDTSFPPWKWTLEVLSSAPQNGFVQFQLRGPTTALVGPTVSRYFTSADFPASPVYPVQI